jgi:hypothetical protein
VVPNIPDLLTVHELAGILKLSHRSIWRLAAQRPAADPYSFGFVDTVASG